MSEENKSVKKLPEFKTESDEIRFWETHSIADYWDGLEEGRDIFKRPKLRPITLKFVLYVDSQKVADGRIPKTQPFVFSGDEGVDVGLDGETAVSNDS